MTLQLSATDDKTRILFFFSGCWQLMVMQFIQLSNLLILALSPSLSLSFSGSAKNAKFSVLFLSSSWSILTAVWWILANINLVSVGLRVLCSNARHQPGLPETHTQTQRRGWYFCRQAFLNIISVRDSHLQVKCSNCVVVVLLMTLYALGPGGLSVEFTSQCLTP